MRGKFAGLVYIIALMLINLAGDVRAEQEDSAERVDDAKVFGGAATYVPILLEKQ